MSEDIVLCKNCRYSFRTWVDILFGSSSLKCRKAFVPEQIKIDPVYGPKKVKAHHELCVIERLHSSDGCNKQGSNWEPKDKKNFFVYLKRV